MAERAAAGMLVWTTGPAGPAPGADAAVPVVQAWAGQAGLAPGPPCLLGRRAGECALDRPPAAALVRLRQLLAGVATDANWVPAADREKRVLVSDMDSTVISVECFDELAELAGVGGEVRALTRRAMAGELSFADAYRARLALVAGVSTDLLETVWRDRVRLNPGAATLVATMAARGARTLLVTGGFRFFARRVAAEAGFGAFRANGIGIAGGRLTGAPAGPILDAASKRRALQRLCRAAGVAPAAAVAVGDGANDAGMVALAGLGVAWRAKPALRRVADAVLEHSGLDAILALQGIPERAHVHPPGGSAGSANAA